MRWIYLSPHFDDAVLSCGGLIWEQTHSGIAVEIWTVCAGNPPPGPTSDYALNMHKIWNTGTAQETVELRRIEDRNAGRRVGAIVQHLPIPDGIYRRTQTGTLIYPETIFTEPNPRDASLAEQVSEQFSDRLTQYDTLVCPLAVGGHVDHRITRMAAEMLKRPLWYYADIPYRLKHPESLPPIAPGFDQGPDVPAIRPPLWWCVRRTLKERTRREAVLRSRRVLSRATYHRSRGGLAS